MPHMKTLVRKDLEARLANAEQTAATSREALEALKNLRPATATYHITLNSCWADYGEQHISKDYKGPLADAIKTAEAEFMRVNKREDVQAQYAVAVHVGETTVALPPTIYQALKHKR
jgi:hypothetical protein